MFDEPPEPPEPKDDPEGYAEYLRRNIVAMARVVVRNHVPKLAPLVQSDHSYCPIKSPTMKDLGETIERLDKWKKEFKLPDID